MPASLLFLPSCLSYPSLPLPSLPPLVPLPPAPSYSRKGDYTYRVMDYASRAVVEVERLQTHAGVSFPELREQDPMAKATNAVSTASAEHAFLMLFLDNASQKEENYILLAQNEWVGGRS